MDSAQSVNYPFGPPITMNPPLRLQPGFGAPWVSLERKQKIFCNIIVLALFTLSEGAFADDGVLEERVEQPMNFALNYLESYFQDRHRRGGEGTVTMEALCCRSSPASNGEPLRGDV